MEASEEPSDDRTDELTGDEFRDAAEQSRRQHSWSEDATRWGLVGRLLSKSSEDGEPVRVKFSAVIRSASYRPDGRRSRNVKLTFDRVAWNPKYTDGGDADVILNPVIKWETLTSGDLLVLINPGDGLHQVPIEKLPAYVSGEHAANKEAGVSDWGTPFFVYFVGDEPVALVEWYVP